MFLKNIIDFLPEEVGLVISVYDGLVHVIGLEESFLGEILIFEKSEGMIYGLTYDFIQILNFGFDWTVSQGEIAERTYDLLCIEFNFKKNILNGFGRSIFFPL